jgi:hypothetical protein
MTANIAGIWQEFGVSCEGADMAQADFAKTKCEREISLRCRDWSQRASSTFSGSTSNSS